MFPHPARKRDQMGLDRHTVRHDPRNIFQLILVILRLIGKLDHIAGDPAAAKRNIDLHSDCDPLCEIRRNAVLKCLIQFFL